MSKLAYPKGRLLLVRDCTVDICLKNNPGAVLLSVLLFWYDNPHKGDFYDAEKGTFTVCRTQEDIEQQSCNQIDVKTIHDVAVPFLQLFGFLDIKEKMFGNLYTVNIKQVEAAYAALSQGSLKQFLLSSLQLEKFLIGVTEDELEKFLIDKKFLLLQLEKVLIQNREISNCKRGRKPRPQQAEEAISENVEIIREYIEIDTKRDSSAFAPADFLPSEEPFSEEDEVAPTVHRMPAIKLNGAIHATVDTAGLHSGSNHGDSANLRGSLRGSLPDRPLEQTPGTPALPSSADPPVGRSHGIRSDQASLSVSVVPEPAQADFPPAGNVASGVTTAQASGEPKETAKQKKARLERRRDEIIALHCQLLGRNVVRSKDELEGAKLMAEAGCSDAEITITYNRYKKDKFWGHQLTLKNVAKLLDTTVANDTSVPQAAKPKTRPKPEDRNISIYEIDPSWQVWQRPGEDQEWIWWQGEFWTPDEADDRGYNGGGGLYIQTQYAQGV